MPVNPKFLAARAAEARHRALAQLRAVAWLPLHRRGRLLARTPVVPLTFRHRLELELARNGFFSPRPVLRGDIFLFLWRLHPLYRAPRFDREGCIANLGNRRARFLRLWFALGSFAAARAHRRLTRLSRQCDLSAAHDAICDFVDIAHQDEPGNEPGNTPGKPRLSRAAPERNAADNLIDWLMTTYHMGHAEALDFPIALSNQLYRERLLQSPDGALAVFAPSDALLAS